DFKSDKIWLHPKTPRKHSIL
ncbi:unnamed protein product, partial [Hermetia illucens]